MKYIYADNAATSKLDNEAFDAMLPWLQEEYGNASQPYKFARMPKKAIADAREIIADCINAAPEEVFFTSGGTESDNWAIKGSIFAETIKNETITSAIEHPAILNSCKSIESQGYPVIYLQPDKEGVISPCLLEKHITSRTHLVSVMLANNEIGTIEPVSELARVSHKLGALFHTDAVQAVGHIPIDVQELGVDMLSASAHKFNGPKGIGFLFVREGTELASFIDGGGQERNHRAGTENVAAIVGMAVALKNCCANMERNRSRILSIEDEFINVLSESGLDYIRNGSANHIPGNISLSFLGADGEGLLHRLDLMGISISTGSACDSKNTQISHVIKAIGLDKEYAYGTIRISLGINNNQGDGEAIARAIMRVLEPEK
jgi:cysteine desulfurase